MAHTTDDHVRAALSANVTKMIGVPSSTTGEMPDLSGMLIEDPLRAGDLAAFFRDLRDRGPDAGMEKLDAVEYVSPSDCQDIGWVFTTRAFLNHLIRRLETLEKEGK